MDSQAIKYMYQLIKQKQGSPFPNEGPSNMHLRVKRGKLRFISNWIKEIIKDFVFPSIITWKLIRGANVCTIQSLPFQLQYACVCDMTARNLCVCLCVCVCEREWKRGRERARCTQTRSSAWVHYHSSQDHKHLPSVCPHLQKKNILKTRPAPMPRTTLQHTGNVTTTSPQSLPTRRPARCRCPSQAEWKRPQAD